MSQALPLTRRQFTLTATLALFAFSRTAVASSKAITVYKDPDCSCCNAWVEHLAAHGFAPKVVLEDDFTTLIEKYGITEETASCHTGVVDGFVMEGHVPAADISKFLAQKPKDAVGLTVPGMPIGSPGMESSKGTREPFNVLLLKRDGSTSIFTRYL